MDTRIDQTDVQDALARLGVTESILADGLRAGYLAWASCTENDPPSFAGLSQWARTLRGLCEGLLPLGWCKSDEKNYSTIMDPTGRFAIAVSSECENTGRLGDRIPTTKSEKGPRTADAVLVNERQMELFPRTFPPVRENLEGEKLTWLLLFHRDRNEIRAELSLPASMSVDGHINGWRERIILTALPLDPEPSEIVPDFAPQPEVDVRRKGE